MTIQRGIGILYSIFASLVYLVASLGRVVIGLPAFKYADIVTFACVAVFTLSIFFESKIFKALQILLILTVSTGELIQGEYYLGLALFTNMFFIMYAYGVYNKYAKIKIIASIIIVYSIYLFMSFSGVQTLAYSINWMVFMIVHITAIWFIFKQTVDKAKKFDSSKEMQLTHKIDEMTIELHKTQAQLSDAVASGLELLGMVKDMKNGKR